MGLFANAAPVSDSELYEVLFRPGFSTAESVTDLSGRGVGLDVVRRKIDAQHGSVQIASEEGRGTTITIRLPLDVLFWMYSSAPLQALQVEMPLA